MLERALCCLGRREGINESREEQVRSGRETEVEWPANELMESPLESSQASQAVGASGLGSTNGWPV